MTTAPTTNLRPAIADEDTPDLPRQRVRITYEKGESIKFISHQDEFRAWERALRRSGLPLLYKQGFNPQPHIQFASPLGVGFAGERELVDITFSPPMPLDALRERITGSLPPGLCIHGIVETELKGPALQTLLIGADYSLSIMACVDELSPAGIEERIATFLATEEVWRTRERKGKTYTYNLRPLVYELRYEGYDAGTETHAIFLRVQQREGATGRPDEVVAALGMDDCARVLRRERLYFADDGADAAQFARYAVVSKEAVAGEPARTGRRQPQKAEGGPKPRTGRNIGERAADEFD
jgi:radical SAM-linked protein